MNVDEINAAVWDEGWGVFDSYGSAGGPLQIQKIDEEGIFDDDCEVWEMVWRRAAEGDEVCQGALEVVREFNLLEYRSIQHWCLHGTPANLPAYDYGRDE